MDRRDEHVAWDHLLPLDVDRLVRQKAKLPNWSYHGSVSRIAQRLVLHHVDLALIRERQGADPTAGMEGLERPDGRGKLDRFDLAQGIHLDRSPAAENP